MNKTPAPLTQRVATMLLAALPWVLSMFVLYYLDTEQIWTTATAHRGKISVMILVAGMILSFLLYSRFNANKAR